MKYLFDERRKEKLGYLKKDLDNVSQSARSVANGSNIDVTDREHMEKNQYKIQKMDRKLKRINCRINFHIENLSFELTGNKTDAQGNQKLISLGFEN